MAVQELIEIIIKAQDSASDTAKKVDDQMKKIGDSATKAGQKTAQASKLSQQQMNNLSHKIADVITSTNQVGSKGASQFQRYNNSLQDSIVKFNMLDNETQEMLQYLSQMSEKGRETFLGMSTKAQEAVAKFNALENATQTWSGSLDYSRSKLELLGTNTESLRGKIQVVGNSIQTYLGNKWDGLKSKVSSFGSFIVSNLTSALSRVRSAVDTVGSAFSGLGGIISSAIGMVGMSSISDMTVGLAMNRERMTALTSATMGSAEAGQKFVDVMDNLTNTSLVSLDDLGQAMSTIKMSTGMTNDQLESFTTTVNDVGQRAILMGKNGDEAMALMQAAGRGLNGEFDMLKTNFGITKDKLEELGWSGAADDVEGYQKALNKALEAGGSMNGMMDTSVGHIETLKKNFRIAGRHVGEMFTPYIDQAVQKLNELSDSCPGLFENLVMIAGGISMFATAAPAISPMLQVFDMLAGKTKALLVFFGLLEAEEGALTASGLAASASQTMLTIAEAAGAEAAVLETAANAGLTASFWAMATAILANPLTWVAVALIAIAVAVYEVGKSFGWWKDVGSMLQAVWAGLQRLWAAFINHPDVQAAIKAISVAFGVLCDWIGQAWNAIAKFFNISQSGEFDIVHAIIVSIGLAWQVMTGHIRLVIEIVQTVWEWFNTLYTTLQPFGEWLWNVLAPVWQLLANVINAITPYVYSLMNAFTLFANGQMNLPTLIWTVLTTLWNVYVTVFSMIIAAVGRWANQIIGRGVNMASQFVNRIVSWLRTLPGKALSALMGVVSSIVSAGNAWIRNATEKAQSIVDGVYNTLTSMPGRVASALNGVVDAIVKPFQDAYNKAKEYWDKITSLGGLAAGGTDLAAGGETSYNSGIENITSSAIQGWIADTSQIDVNMEHKITLDLVNVPGHIDTNTLITMLKDKAVLKALTGNRDFQQLDSQMKNEILRQVNRARGV